MIKIPFFAIAICLVLGTQPAFAQQMQPYSFKSEKQVTATPVKNQQQTGTCWAFSCASFLESEVLRLNGFEVNLSEMYVVRHVYRQKCENYVRRQGHAQFGEGGLAHDLIRAVHQYGIVPEDVYPGRKSATQVLNHSKLEKKLKGLCDDYAKLGTEGKLPTNWLTTIDAVLDEEFGVVPEKFTVENRPYTPTIYRDYLGIKTEDYLTITSFTHHPFYEPFVLEIPDNFANGLLYNLPIDQMMRCLNSAIEQGYSVEWDADVSNEGFSAQNGLAIVPQQAWATKSEAQRESTFKFYESEQKVTQQSRQDLFDQQVTMDDHLMHITGMERETGHNEIYYLVKNSWGEISTLKGYLRVSEAYMRLNTISFMVNKNVLPLDIRQRLGLESTEARTPNTTGDTDLKTKAPAKIKSTKTFPAATKSSPAKSE